jgi:hypothetical protein
MLNLSNKTSPSGSFHPPVGRRTRVKPRRPVKKEAPPSLPKGEEKGKKGKKGEFEMMNEPGLSLSFPLWGDEGGLQMTTPIPVFSGSPPFGGTEGGLYDGRNGGLMKLKF